MPKVKKIHVNRRRDYTCSEMAWLSWLVRVFTPLTMVIRLYHCSQTSKDMIAHHFHAIAGENITIRAIKVNQNSKVMKEKTKTMSY